MNKTIIALAAVMALGLGFGGAAQAANSSAVPPSVYDQLREGGVVKAQYGYCANAYRLCRYRWGFGWRFRRCMAIRGCL